jgi:hypothetical protein
VGVGVGLFAWPFNENTGFEAQFDDFEIVISDNTRSEEGNTR